MNRTIGWWQFFSALKHAFFNKKVSLKPENRMPDPKKANDHSSTSNRNAQPDIWRMIIELNFTTIGRTSLTLKLRQTADPWSQIAENFLCPLFDFYSVRTESAPKDKVESIRKEIKLYKVCNFTNLLILIKIKILRFLRSKGEGHASGTATAAAAAAAD